MPRGKYLIKVIALFILHIIIYFLYIEWLLHYDIEENM